MDSDRIFSVSVLEGSHAGATLELAPGKYRVGRSQEADLVLTDSGLAPLHFSVELARRGASVTSMEGPVTLDGPAASSSKNSARLQFPFEIAVEGVRLRVEGPEAASWEKTAARYYDRCQTWIRQQRRAPMMAALALALVSLAAIGAPNSGAQPGASRADAASTAEPDTSITQAVTALRKKAEDAGLSPQLEIEPAGDAIAVRGTLMKDQLATWQRLRQEFDTAFGNKFAFDSQINTGNATVRPQLDVQAIWSGYSPYLITMSGERLTEGDRLVSGWTIEKIESRRVVLSQGDQRMALTY